MQRNMSKHKLKINFKRTLIMVLMAVIIASTGIPVYQDTARADAASSTVSVTESRSLNVNLTRWILDEANGYLYAISSSENKLYFIRTSDLEIEHSLNIGSAPTDLDLYEGKLYVTNSGATLIKELDIANKTETRSFSTSVQPNRLAVMNGKIYYASTGSQIYQVDLLTGSNTLVNGSNAYNSYAKFAADRENNKLYVANSSNLQAYLADGQGAFSKIGGAANVTGGDAILLQGEAVLFASSVLNRSDVSAVEGKFVHTYSGSNVLAANAQYAITNSILFDRKTYLRLADFSDRLDLAAIDGSDVIYGYNQASRKISKLTPTPGANMPIAYSNVGSDTITFNQSITEWAASEDGSYLYAISKEANRLLYIRTSDWTVIKDMHIGAQPTDLSVVNGQVYVALNASNYIGVVTPTHNPSVQDDVYRMKVAAVPIRIDGGNEQLFFTDSYTTYVVNAVYGEGKSLSGVAYWPYSPNDLVYDKESQYLYVNSSSNLSRAQVPTLTAAYLSSSYMSTSSLVKDGSYVYRGIQRLSDSVANQVYGSYGQYQGDPVIYAKGEAVFTRQALYDRDTFNKIMNLPEAVSSVYIDQAGDVYIFYSSSRKAVKYDSLDALKLQNPANHPPTEAVRYPTFNDQDQKHRYISGTLNWWNPNDVTNITHYAIYFLDNQFQKIGEKLGTAVTNYFEVAADTKIPEHAKYLGVYSSNQSGESSVFGYIEIRDWSISQVVYSEFTLIDSNPNRGEYELSGRWSGYINYGTTYTLELYYADNLKTPMGEKVAEKKIGVESHGADRTEISLTPSVPLEAKYVLVRYRTESNDYDPLISYAIIPDNISAEPVTDHGDHPGSPSFEPVAQIFVFDDDPKRNQIGGLIGGSIWPSTGITGYVLYFLNEHGERVQPLLELPYDEVLMQSLFSIPLPMGTKVPEGAVQIGLFLKNIEGEGKKSANATIWDNPFGEPKQLTFRDKKPTKGLGDTVIEWALNGPEEALVAQYELHVWDNNYETTLTSLPLKVWQPGAERYNVTLPAGSIPDSATRVSIRAKDKFGRYMSSVLEVPIADDISEMTESLHQINETKVITPIQFTDVDGEAGQIGGQLLWSSSLSYYQFPAINLYFTNDAGRKIKPIIQVRNSSLAIHTMQIPMNTLVPGGATKIGLFPFYGELEGTGSLIDFTDRVYSSPLSDEEIVIVNNPEGIDDTITVSSSTPFSRVLVYRNDTVPYPLAQSVFGSLGTTGGPNAGGSEGNFNLTLTVPQLGKEAGSVFVTVERPGLEYTESARVEKNYAAETDGSDPGTNPGTDPGTTPGGGSGNNPGTGSGSNPPPAIGGGGGSAPSQPQQADSTYTPQLTSETSNGVAYQVATLDAGKLAEAFKQASEEKQSAVVIDLKDAPNAKVTIPAEAWLAAAGQADGGGVLSIRNATVAYDLPASVFQLSALAEQLGADPKDIQLTVTFTEVNETMQKQIDEGAKASGLSFIAPPVEFTVAVSAGDKQIVIDHFGDTYVTRTILLPQTVNPSDTVAVRYDPTTGSLHFVPALFETKANGTTEAKLMRQGNSIYAVAQATSRVFTDVQQHWAKREIEQLAAKLIVNGQDEQRFGPDLPVTRAEFAALLVRALGISEQPSAKATFRDVPADAWYAGEVAAASEKRLVEGDETGAFAPNERITREQMAVMITRALRLAAPQAGAVTSDLSGLSAYADRDEVASWAQAAVAQTVQAGLMQGTQPGRFEPGREASRAEAAVMLQRLLQHVGFMNR